MLVHSPGMPEQGPDKGGALLGENGITISGMHKAHDEDRPMKKKEREFWDKVEQIKKGLPS